jgi:ABC-type glutathione transport system ATPase component
LILDPDVLILDESLSGLDPRTLVNVADLIAELQAERSFSCVVISHDLRIIRYLTTSAAVMLQGLIVESGPTREVLSNPRHPYTRSLLSAMPNVPGLP